MLKKCCVPNCKGNYPNGLKVSCFKFSKDEKRKNMSVHDIKRLDFKHLCQSVEESKEGKVASFNDSTLATYVEDDKVVVLCTNVAGRVLVQKVNATKPKISIHGDISQDIVLNPGDNYNLTCQGNRPLVWHTPEINKVLQIDSNKNQWTTFSTTNFGSPHSSLYNYGSVLHITNMSYPFVGYYTCLYEGSDESTEEKEQVYLYVNDPDHLSAIDELEVETIVATQNENVTLPCRPTSPDVVVTLAEERSDVDYSYDPKTGFTYLVTDFEYVQTCLFKKNGKEFEMMIFLSTMPSRESLTVPLVEDINKNHTDEGEELKINCSLKAYSAFVTMVWDTPTGRKNGATKQNGDIKVNILSVPKAQLSDSGIYTCIVSDKQGHEEKAHIHITVHATDECYVSLTQENDLHYVEFDLTESQTFRYIVQIAGHPWPEFQWYNPNGEAILTNKKYLTNFTSTIGDFQIYNVTLLDSGNYTLHAKSKRSHPSKTCPAEDSLSMNLVVLDKPSVNLIAQDFYVKNSSNTMECRATGFPIPTIIWEEKECLDEYCQFKEVNAKSFTVQKFQNISIFEVNTTREGVVRCSAYNSLGPDGDYHTVHYYLSDVKQGFDMYNFGDTAFVEEASPLNNYNKEVLLAKGDSLMLTCAVSQKKSMDVQVFHNSQELFEGNNVEGYFLTTTKDPLSLKKTLKIPNAQFEDSGEYSCRAKDLSDSTKYYTKNAVFNVTDPVAPVILETNMRNATVKDYPNTYADFYCKFTGIPKPNIHWYKDNEPIIPSERIVFEEDSQKLMLKKTKLTDDGTYKCVVSNYLGTVVEEAKLQFKYKEPSLLMNYSISGVVGVSFIIALIIICVKTRKERQLRRELKRLGLENFEKGNPESLNPDLGIDDQAELLPYNKKFEFPIEHLKLGKQLGSGAFGVVLKGEAKRIVEGEEKTTVAVKMVKKNADDSYIRALASELKIMVHLGKHVNVVNLLGACTKNVAKKELLVIVEYCRFGNVQNYLLRHRESFINQVDPTSGNINYYIGSEFINGRSFSTSSEYGEPTTPHSMQDYRGRTASGMTQMTTLPNTQGDESVLLSNNSIQPDWRSNYRGDYKGNVRPVSTKDLIAWSFQIARGMEYLASRKVLHGDLAARNILLSDNNIVKICDFGLAKTMYNDNNYKKKGNGPLPVKWMAIESIRDKVFSTQSDVWSFGIVLWELFSLAKMPYPGMDPDERLYYRLADGYRMESPDYAPKVMYDIMLQCWDAKPLVRPTFTELTRKIGYLLDESEKKYYVDLNDPYLAINIQKREEDNDYLAMLTPPSFDVLSTPPPHYSNEMIATSANPADKEGEGYTFMGGNSSKHVFSPTRLEDEVFDFGTKGRRKLHNDLERKSSQEVRPMLHSQVESDTEGYLIPDFPVNSISNPSYQMGSILNSVNENSKSNNKNKKQVKQPDIQNELFNSPDNYVNVPQYKNLMHNNSELNNKDFVKIDVKDKGNKVQYVNGDMWDSIEV